MGGEKDLRKLLVFAAIALAVSAWGQQKSTFQDLYVLDDTTLGSSSGDTLTINAATSYVGPLLFGDGTVSAPAVSFTADTNVGMWRSAADTLNFSVGGAEVCEFGATANAIANVGDTTTMLGFVRVGTGASFTAASSNDDLGVEDCLEVDGEAQFDGIIDANSTSDFAGDAVFNEDVSLAVASDDKVTFTSGYFTQFRVGTASTPDVTLGVDDVFIEGSLEADGVVSVSAGAVGAVAIYSAADVDTGMWWSAADTLNFSVAGVEVCEFGATANSLGNASDTTTLLGALRVGTGGSPDIALADDKLYVEGTAEVDGVVSVSLGAVGAPAVYPAADTDTGLWFSGADMINLSVAGVEVAEFGATANSLGNASDTTTVLGFLRIGTGASFTAVSTDDDLGVEGACEVDGELQADGILDVNSTSDFAADAVFNENVQLGIAADDIVTFTDGYFTQFRIGTGDTPDIAMGADNAFIEGSVEIEGELQCDGIVDANSTSDFNDTAVFSKGTGDAVQISSGGTLDADGDIECAGVMSYGIGTLGDTDLTPDVSSATVWKSQSNTGATAITDLDNPVVGSIVVIICAHANNPPSIADAGNFKLSAAWNSGIDDTITLYVMADNEYIELSRSAN